MDPLTIIAGITTAVKVGREALTLVHEFQGRMSEEDEGKLKAALKELQATNDELYAATLHKLSVAGGEA